MEILKLFLSFMKIGLFSFGGGYAMIPLIQQEIESNGWLTPVEFADIVAIAEMTPGPIAVNSATFVGYRVAGVLGSIAATTGVATPSFVLMLIVSSFFIKFQKHPLKIMAFYGIRPAVTGLIFAAGVFIAESSILKGELSVRLFKTLFANPLNAVDIKGLFIMAVALVLILRFRINPILVVAIAGISGILLYYLPALFQNSGF